MLEPQVHFFSFFLHKTEPSMSRCPDASLEKAGGIYVVENCRVIGAPEDCMCCVMVTPENSTLLINCPRSQKNGACTDAALLQAFITQKKDVTPIQGYSIFITMWP